MNTFIPLDKLATIDLENYYEVWQTTSEVWPQDPSTAHSDCLWRADRQLTEEVEIDEAYFQNLPRLWLLVSNLTDSGIEQALTRRLAELQLAGEFHPQEKPKVASGDKNTDLRS